MSFVDFALWVVGGAALDLYKRFLVTRKVYRDA